MTTTTTKFSWAGETQAPIFAATVSSVVLMVRNVISSIEPWTGIQIQQVGGIEGVRRLFQDRGPAAKYPFFSYILTGVRPNPNSFNSFVMRQHGIIVGMDSGGQDFIKYYLEPVILTFRVLFFAQDFIDVTTFANVWTSNQRRLNLILDQRGTRFSCRLQVETSRDLTIPDVAWDEQGTLYGMETTLEIESYTGFASTVKQVTRIVIDAILGKTRREVEEMESRGIDTSAFHEIIYDKLAPPGNIEL